MVLHSLLAASSAREEFCAVVDWRGAFDPLSASRAGVDLRRLLWVRANRQPLAQHRPHALRAVGLAVSSEVSPRRLFRA